MHTFTASDGTVIIYNPDLSDVRINVINEHIEDISYTTDLNNDEPLSQVQVSGQALLEFITEYYRNKAITELENMDVMKFIKDL